MVEKAVRFETLVKRFLKKDMCALLGLKQLHFFCNRLTVGTNRNRNRLTDFYYIVVRISSNEGQCGVKMI